MHITTHFYLLPLVLLCLAVLVPLVLSFQRFQSLVIYWSELSWPSFIDFTLPTQAQRFFYRGIACSENIQIPIYSFLKPSSSSTRSINGWFIHPCNQQIIQDTSRLVLYFHGNAESRAFTKTLDRYEFYTTQLSAHVLAIDYTGFADNPLPADLQLSQQVLADDVYSVLRYVRQHYPDVMSRLLVHAHSLGSAALLECLFQLKQHSTDFYLLKPRALVIESPFTRIRDVVLSYVPFYSHLPAVVQSSLSQYVDGILNAHHVFNNQRNVVALRDLNVLLLHGENDWIVSVEMGRRVFQQLVNSTANTSSTSSGNSSSPSLIIRSIADAVIYQHTASASQPNSSVSHIFVSLGSANHQTCLDQETSRVEIKAMMEKIEKSTGKQSEHLRHETV